MVHDCILWISYILDFQLFSTFDVVTHFGMDHRVSTLFQPNVGVFGIDLSGGRCWELPMSNRYSHPSSENTDFSGANRVSAAFQLRLSYIATSYTGF